MTTAQNYALPASYASGPQPAALRLATILFNDYFHQQPGSATVVQGWYGAFKRNVYDVLAHFGYSEDQAEYALRSRPFCEYVQQQLAQA